MNKWRFIFFVLNILSIYIYLSIYMPLSGIVGRHRPIVIEKINELKDCPHKLRNVKRIYTFFAFFFVFGFTFNLLHSLSKLFVTVDGNVHIYVDVRLRPTQIGLLIHHVHHDHHTYIRYINIPFIPVLSTKYEQWWIRNWRHETH